MGIQARAAGQRAQYVRYLRIRFWIVVLLLTAYVAACIGLPWLHASEATCTQGFFWETHLQFLGIFTVTKLVELLLCLLDPMLEWNVSCFNFTLRFFPSFIGYFDGYSDATAVVIAHACQDELAQRLSLFMAAFYLIGVVGGQWLVLLVLAARDPSQACLLKLVHMDLLASCITLPADQKETWDLIALIRTIGEDLPQAVMQSLYILYVKRNPFMMASVVVSVLSSLKALKDARDRALASDGAQAEFEQRKRESVLYSGNYSGEVRLWDISSGDCLNTIETGSRVNAVAATQGKVYTSHDDGLVREWSPETGEPLRTFAHPGKDVYIVATATHLYSSSLVRGSGDAVLKEWSLQTAECTRQFPANAETGSQIPMFAQGRSLFAAAPDNVYTVAEWSLDSGERLRSYEGHTDTLNSLLATTQRLFSGSDDKSLREWSRATGECMRTFAPHQQRQSMNFSIFLVGDLLCSPMGKNSVACRSLKTGALVRELTAPAGSDYINNLATVEGHLYGSTSAGKILKWSLSTGDLVDTYESDTNSGIYGIAFQFRED